MYAVAGIRRAFVAVRTASLFLLSCGRALSRWNIIPRRVFRPLSWQTCSTKSGALDSTKEVVLYFMPFGTYNKILIPLLPQIVKTRHFSDWIFASEFQTCHLDLRLSPNDENIQQRNSFPPLLIGIQTHIVDLVRVSGEALGRIRPATAFDRLPVNAEHSIN
jgi:hypothetical protein